MRNLLQDGRKKKGMRFTYARIVHVELRKRTPERKRWVNQSQVQWVSLSFEPNVSTGLHPRVRHSAACLSFLSSHCTSEGRGDQRHDFPDSWAQI